MTLPIDIIRSSLKELERSFAAFEKGERGRLFESRDSLTALSAAVDETGSEILGPICEIASRLLGMVLMEGKLTEVRAVQVVRELLSFIEAQVLNSSGSMPAEAVGGVFHVVNSERVGDMLVRRGFIAPDQLEKALLLQRVSKGKRVGQVLVAMNAIDQRTLESILDSQKAETRREETRRFAGPQAGQPGHVSPRTGPADRRGLSPLPPLPGGPPPLGAPQGPGAAEAPAPPTELRLAPPPGSGFGHPEPGR